MVGGAQDDRRDVMAYLRGWVPAEAQAVEAPAEAQPVEAPAEATALQAAPAAIASTPERAEAQADADAAAYRPRGPGRRTAKRLLPPDERARLEASERLWAALPWVTRGVVLAMLIVGTIATALFRH